MQINIIRVLFIFCSLSTATIGLLLNYLEPYLTTSITRSYRYGKFSTNAHQPMVARVEVPKVWFKHFYRFAAPASTYVSYVVIRKYLWNDNVPKIITWMLNMCMGSSRQPLVSAESTFVAILLITLQSWKRLYETHCVSIFSDKKMNISHYMVGFYHYFGTLLSIIGESEGFVEGSKGNFSWQRITSFQLICAIIIMLSSYAQLRSNFILSSLRKNDNGKMNSAVYKIPHGGLFEYISGALQITEIIIYVMLSVILWESSTYHYVTLWVLSNQISTAAMTHDWYKQTFPNYPKSRKVLIPYIF